MAAATPRGRVLVVDDDKFMRVYLRDTMRSAGHDVEEAANGEEALAAVRASPPRVVLLDLLMPTKNGLETLPLLRALCPDSRIIVVSSLDNERLITQAMHGGASDFVTKPFHPTELLAAVQRALTEVA